MNFFFALVLCMVCLSGACLVSAIGVYDLGTSGRVWSRRLEVASGIGFVLAFACMGAAIVVAALTGGQE